MFDMDFRICYYLGSLSTYYMEHKGDSNQVPLYEYKKKFEKNKEIPEFKDTVANMISLKLQIRAHSNPRLKTYCQEMYTFMMQAGIKPDHLVQVKMGDNTTGTAFYSFSKTKPVHCQDIILLNLHKKRHWKDIPIVKEHDIPFHLKKDIVIWRGSSTGEKRNTDRDTLVRMYQHHPRQDIINIRFSNLVQGYQNINKRYLLQPMSIQDQLKHKFIISIEGNDVATNLKWLMYSNSVVFMPPPRIVSWFMEDKLIPYVHYIPLKEDLSDVEEQYQWCMAHLTECEQIAKNGKEYVEQFLDDEREQEITKKVIQTYCKAVKIISN